MAELVIVAAFAFGAVVGSFLNVCIFRIPRRCLRIWKPRRSHCPRCHAEIAWYDNVPLLSYVWLGGRCRRCKAAIAFRYFLVEALTGLLFALCAHHAVVRPLADGDAARWPLFAIYAAATGALVVCTFVDLDFQIIPDAVDLPGMALAPFLGAAYPALHRDLPDLARLGVPAGGAWYPHAQGLAASLLGAAAGAGVIWAIGAVGKLIFRKEAMGLGDVKYMGMLGGILGWKGVAIGLVLACVAGALIGIVVKLVTRQSYIPFGPFLSLGAFLTMLYRPEIVYGLFVAYPRWVAGCSGG